MQFTWVSFNFQGADLAAEERHYLSHHVALARQLPGLRCYFTARARDVRGERPRRLRSALLGFEDAQAAADAMRAPVIGEILADTQSRLKDMRSLNIEGRWATRFDSRRPLMEFFLFVAEFGFKPSLEYAAAERHYLDVHVGIARRLPGLRGYIVGRISSGVAERDAGRRVAILGFDSHAAFRESFRSPVGRELNADGEATISDPDVCHLDARVEM